jgi:thioredoxin-related protein
MMSRIVRQLTSGIVPVLLFPFVLTPVAGASAPWPTNFQAAQAQAKAQNKPLLVAFTGSDWCPWCQKLKVEVFDKPPFPAEARKHFVLIDIDFPHDKKLSDTLKEQNDKLAKKYGVNSFPSVLLMKPSGELMARAGYNAGGPEKYLNQLTSMLKTYEGIAPLRAKLPEANGLDRARILDELIQSYNKLNNEVPAIPGWRKEILALDSDNSAGLKRKYEFRVYFDDARNMLGSGKPGVAQNIIDKALALTYLNPQQVQRALIVKSNCCVAMKRYQASLDNLHKALDLAPKSPNADTLKDLIKKSEKLLDENKPKTAGVEKGA